MNIIKILLMSLGYGVSHLTAQYFDGHTAVRIFLGNVNIPELEVPVGPQGLLPGTCGEDLRSSPSERDRDPDWSVRFLHSGRGLGTSTFCLVPSGCEQSPAALRSVIH